MLGAFDDFAVQNCHGQPLLNLVENGYKEAGDPVSLHIVGGRVGLGVKGVLPSVVLYL